MEKQICHPKGQTPFLTKPKIGSLRIESEDEELIDLPVLDGATADEVADSLIHAIGQCDAVLLCLASELCLSATLNQPNGQGSRNLEELRFELESSLPIVVEDVASDFIIGDKESVLGVVVENQLLQPVLAAFREKGIRLRCATTTAVLAAQNACRTLAHSEPTLVVWRDAARCECFYLRERKLIEWAVIANCDDSILQYVNAFRFARQAEPMQVEVMNSPTIIDAARAEAVDVLAGRSTPWIDFLSGGDPFRSVRPMLRFAMCALVLLCLTLSTSLLVRAHQYQSHTEQLVQQQEALFLKVFPGQRVSRTVAKRLRSEQVRLQELGATTEPERTRPILSSLFHVLQALPEDDRYRLLQIEVSPSGSAMLVGETESDDAPQWIAKQLRQAGFDVTPSEGITKDEQFEMQIRGPASRERKVK